MDAETINAVAGLWKLALIALLMLVVVIFRKSLGGVLAKGDKRLRYKSGTREVEVQLSQSGQEQELIEEPTDSAVAAPPQERLEKTPEELILGISPKAKIDGATSSEEGTGGEQPTWSKVLTALSEGKKNEADELASALSASEPDSSLQQKSEGFYLYLQIRLGDAESFRKLKDLAATAGGGFLYHLVGECYELGGRFDDAAKAYLLSLKTEDNELARIDRLGEISRCYFKAGEEIRAVEVITSEIPRLTQDEARSKAYGALAQIYEWQKNHRLRSIALHKALEYAPNDTNILFQSAYSFAEANDDDIAIMHYRTLLSFDSKNSAALNNVALEYQDLGLPIRAVNHYEAAMEQGETLAMANLAAKYRIAGFAENARALLLKAQTYESPHSSVARGIVALENDQEAEDRKNEDMISQARPVQRFLLRFAEAYFTDSQKEAAFLGNWTTQFGIPITLSEFLSDPQSFAGKWLHSDSRIEGRSHNRGALITIGRGEFFVITTQETGFAYLDPRTGKLLVMTRKREGSEIKTSFEEFERNTEP